MLFSYLKQGKKLFLPSRHLWLQLHNFQKAQATSISSTQSIQHIIVNVGITERGLDDIGDITAIVVPDRFKSVNGTDIKISVRSGDDVLKLRWDGYFISEADELYHTVWESRSESTPVASPVDGILKAIHDVSAPRRQKHIILQSDTSLFTIQTDLESVFRLEKDQHIMGDEEYQNYIQGLEGGKFSDPSDK